MEKYIKYMKDQNYLKAIMSASHDNFAAEMKIKNEENSPRADEYFKKKIFIDSLVDDTHALLKYNQLGKLMEQCLIQSENFYKEYWKQYIYHLINGVSKALYEKLRVKYDKSDGQNSEWREWLERECHGNVTITFESTMILAVCIIHPI
jgi:hypothetical protein